MRKKNSKHVLVKRILLEAKKRNLYLISAESCTGGLISAALTSVPGSSIFFKKGYITYSNESKIDLLNVSLETIKKFGAVSEEVVKEMVLGCEKKSKDHVVFSISGIAGPGSSENKPVGMVWIAIKTPKGISTKLFNFGNLTRKKIRKKSVKCSLEFLLECLKKI